METIKVNMTPCDEVQTIHASQNDGEAREWGFALHNNGDVIDSSSISDQLVFKSYEGGTEQILPENGAVPVTAPFVGDINYPDTTRNDQEFLYRQSPTEEDGNAKITDIKGNTLVWNQLVPPLSAMQGQNGTISVADNVATITSSSSTGYLGMATSESSIVLPKSGHKYLLTVEVNSSIAVSSCQLSYGNSIIARGYNISANTWTKVSSIVSYSSPTGQYVQCRNFGSFEQGDTMQVRNWNYFDLTAMGLDSITSVEEFTSLFPLPYYSYNQGSLLSFNGNGIKTTGKNQYNNAIGLRNLYLNQNTGLLGNGGTTYVADLITNKQYTLSGTRGNRSLIGFSKKQANELGNGDTIENISSVSLPYTFNSSDYHSVVYYSNTDYVATLGTDVQLEFGSTVTDYEPYTSSTTSLPISTYFPNGMDGVGTAYDELTSSKATTRMDRIDLGSITYSRVQSQTSDVYFFVGTFNSIPNIKTKTNYDVWNIKTPLYETVASTSIYQGTAQNKTIGGYDGKTVRIRDDSFTDATAFKNSLSGQYLVYELATPTETSFTTASLVTENGEIPLSNEDGTLIGKCTEQLSENPGFIDAKIKLSDGDGECYSNKIQLHVERSPQ